MFSPSRDVYPGECMPLGFLRESDQWAYSYVGKYFAYKDMVRGEGHLFADDNPSNLFKILGVALYHSTNHLPLSPKKGTYTSAHLSFVVVSFDAQHTYETYPVKSFHHSLPENRRFYLLRENEIDPDLLHLFRPPEPTSPINVHFMEGVSDDMPIASLSSHQMGVLLTFQPVSTSYIHDSVLLANARKTFLHIFRKLNSDLLIDEKNEFSNLLQVNMYLHRQSGENLSLRKLRERSSHFTDLIVNNRHRHIFVGDFFKKRLVVQQRLKRNFSFQERKISKAKKCIQSMDIKKAM